MESLAQANSAAMSGGLATMMLFPLEKLKTKMASAPTASFVDVIRNTYEKEGISSFYSGSATKLAQSMSGKFLYFFFYSTLKGIYLTKTGEKSLPALMDLMCGYCAELMHLPVTIPMEVVSTRLQMSDPTAKQSITTVLDTLLKNGVSTLWKGLGWAYLCGFMPTIQYTLFEKGKSYILAKNNTTALTSLQAFLCGAIARAIATCVVFPFIRAKVVSQGQNSSKESLLDILKRDVSQNGISALFSGLTPELMRGVLSAAVMMMVKEYTDSWNRKLLGLK